MYINTYEPINSRDRIIQNASAMGFSSNRKWFHMILTKDINVCSYVPSAKPHYISGMMAMFDLYKGHYKENFDIQIIEDTILFRVLYPEVVVNNSEGRSTLVRDLIVIHTFGYNSTNKHVYPFRIEGGRITRTSEEIYSGYQHSHLYSMDSDSYQRNPFYVNSFCVGNSTDISLLEAELEVEMDWNRMELYLFVVDAFVAWESIEGIPYIRMSKIQDQNFRVLKDYTPSVAQSIVNTILSNKDTIDVDFYYEDGRYRIKDNKRTSDFVKNYVLSSLSSSDFKQILCTYNYALKAFVGVDVKTMIKGRPKANLIDGELPYIIFNGFKRPCKAIETNPKERKNKVIPMEDYIIYPKFLDYVIRKLEAELYKKTSTRSAIAYYNSLSNTKPSTESNKISL